MRTQNLNFTALEQCLDKVRHLVIDLAKMKPESEYGVKRGGYGDVSVYTYDCGAPKLVAAKTIRFKDRDKDPKRLAFGLARELAIWATLQHPHILPLLGYHLADNYENAILVSEYMPNGDLKDYIEAERPTKTMRLSLMVDVIKGLRYLHNLNPPVCHADLKMRNILVNRKGRAVLADFGLSVALNDHPTGLSTTTGLKGTLRCYSPELVKDSNPKHSLASDIWALGCVILEALTDVIPHAELKFDHMVVLKLVEGNLPADVGSMSILTREVKDLLTKCWSMSPADRPSALQCLCYIRSAMQVKVPDPELDRDRPRTTQFSPNVIHSASRNRPYEKEILFLDPQQHFRNPSVIFGSPLLVRTFNSSPHVQPTAQTVPGLPLASTVHTSSFPTLECEVEKSIPHVPCPVFVMPDEERRTEIGAQRAVVQVKKSGIELGRRNLPVAMARKEECICAKCKEQRPSQSNDDQLWNSALRWFPKLSQPTKQEIHLEESDPVVSDGLISKRRMIGAAEVPTQLGQSDNISCDCHIEIRSRPKKRLFSDVVEVPEETGRKRPRL